MPFEKRENRKVWTRESKNSFGHIEGLIIIGHRDMSNRWLDIECGVQGHNG